MWLTHVKVEFKVNGVKQDYAMKLGEGGEAFFVFETSEEIPASMQTSPLISPMSSPKMNSDENLPSLQEPEYLDLDQSKGAVHPPLVSRGGRATSDLGTLTLRCSLYPLPYLFVFRPGDSSVAVPG